MSKFGTSGELDVQVSSSSLRDARDEIESELGDVQVDVSTATGGGTGSRIAGRERAMGRQLQTETNEHLSGIGSSWEDNLELNTERNELLQELVDVTEQSTQSRLSRGGGGIGGGMLLGGLALGAGTVGIGSMLFEGAGDLLDDAVDDITLEPSDIVETATVVATDVVESAADVSPSDVVDPVSLAVTDVVESPVELSATDVAIAVTLGPAAVIARKAELDPVDVVTGVSLEAADVVTGVTLEAADVVTDVALEPADVVTGIALETADIVEGTISASAILDRVLEGAGEAVPDASAPDVGVEEIVGGAGVGIAGGLTLRTLLEAGRSGAGRVAPIAGRGAAGAAPVFTPGMFREDMEGLEGTIFDPNHPLRNRGEPVQAGRESVSDPAPMIDENRFEETGGGSGSGEATINTTFDIDADLSDLEREVSDRLRGLERDVQDLERSITGR